MKIKVIYKTTSGLGKEKIEVKEFKSWQEEGSYTIFYEDVSLDSAKLIIPTTSVIEIEIIRE